MSIHVRMLLARAQCDLFLTGVTELLMAPGRFPGSSGTRNLHDNISDLRAQVAANQKVEISFSSVLIIQA